MSLSDFISSYRIATGGDYDFRLEEARLFVSDALEQTKVNESEIISNAAILYDVDAIDI